MDLEPSEWAKVGKINWARIARGHQFYLENGYEYIEVPWAVSQEVIDLTIPKDANPIRIQDSSAILIGSAEQGILSFHQTLIPNKKYLSISPCFRGETKLLVGCQQLTFMKIELFMHGNHSDELMNDALRFFQKETNKDIRQVQQEDGSFDLQVGNLELGSYGLRTLGVDKVCSYGTGLAEPRFSVLDFIL